MTKNRFQKSGAGLGQLLSRSLQLASALPEEADEARFLPLTALLPSPRQPRRSFGADALQQLAESIRQQGVLQPLMVRPLEADGAAARYEIVYGERRWRAAQQAGLSQVPVLIRTLSTEEAELISAVENLQREDLNRYDEVAYKLRLVARLFGWSAPEAVKTLKQLRAQPDSAPQQVAQLDQLFSQLGGEQWRSFVTNGLPALRLPAALVQAVQSGELDYSKALLIARAPKAFHSELLSRVQAGPLSHQQLRAAVAELQPGPRSDSEAQLLSVRKQLSVRKLAQMPSAKRKRAESLLKELSALLSELGSDTADG